MGEGCPLNAKALPLEAQLQLAGDVHLEKSSKVMQMSTDAHESYNQDGFDGCVHQMHI